MPLGLLHALRSPGLREAIRVAARASYYRDAFAAARVDVARARRPEDLGDLYLTPGGLKARPEALVTGTAELAIESSGTTGHATRVYLSRRELEYNARQGGLLYGLYGLGRGDRLLCTLDLAWGLGSLLVERGVRLTPLFAMIAGRVDPMEAYQRLAEYRFNVIVSDPFWLARLTAIARERGRPGPMKLLMGGGEGITDGTRAELERYWGAPLCMTYASTEAATILAFECTHRVGYHVNEFDFYVEIAAPAAEGYGEVVLTTVNRRVMPWIRYRTGDVARWIPGPCPCGLPFRRLSPAERREPAERQPAGAGPGDPARHVAGAIADPRHHAPVDRRQDDLAVALGGRSGDLHVEVELVHVIADAMCALEGEDRRRLGRGVRHAEGRAPVPLELGPRPVGDALATAHQELHRPRPPALAGDRRQSRQPERVTHDHVEPVLREPLIRLHRVHATGDHGEERRQAHAAL